MVQSTVRYKILPRDGQEVTETEDEDDDEITIQFQSPINQQRGSRRRDTYVRVMVALILLGIVCGFMVYEWNGYWSETEDHYQKPNSTTENSEEIEHEHHHNHHEERIDHDDHDHNHEEGDDHHHHSHAHKHTESVYHNAAIITDSAICSRMGKELLEARGNVVDAAIAALLCLGVVHPHAAGLGGAFSAILYNHTLKSFKAIHDTSQKLPSYAAPALLQGLRLLHSNYGHLEWSTLFEGSAKLAKNFSIDGILSRALETHKDKILWSQLCDVFCDADGRVKSEGANVANGKLSELLLSVGQNSSHFSEMLAVKLAQDISEAERPAFLAAARAGSGEINEPLIVKQEKYTILSAPSQLTGGMVTRILDAVRERNLSFQSHGELNDTVSYTALLNLANEFFNTSESDTSLKEILALNTSCSQIGALDSHNNFIIISTSLNSTWGSGRYLPQTGVILSDFTSDITQLPYFSFPLVVKIDEEDDADDHHSEEEEHEMQLVAVTGGLSALFQSVVMIRNLLEMSAQETLKRPLLYLEQREPNFLSGCMSAVTNGSMVSNVLSEGNEQLQGVDKCSGDFLSMLLQLEAEHVGVFGAPVSEVHADGID